ncbi:NAD(P)H nitroreductase [Paenibacillus darwinianus]|uniref:NAD(P)H nitroreductase n=1 Tax=Paenibacillus darwinianus TaxID=1380763 RepID=A0A9W5RYN6_9BACL|nr:nitroreductase family protein [Paenibacillus darwinianus]EXX84868.1 NAD(P)H nitroreductase [Paenibacillus darwinianus]EXX84977.1 NAD(P)H nitroreductase [Paenibacillus darwinianus]EXX85004.1 NAD(P)H nitroreductase [Paenibacillus darwinianus]
MSKDQVEQGIDFFEVIAERHSVRSYDPSYKMSRNELKELLADAVKAPSSSNLQSWRFLVVDDQAAKEKLKPIAFNQKQVTEASAVIAILGDREAYKRAAEIYGRGVEQGYIPADVAENMTHNSVQVYGGMSADRQKDIALVDGGLIAMQLMLAAKARGLDTVPMGGFDGAQLLEAFNVPDTYVPVMLVAVGKAAQPGRPTPRLTVDEVTQWNSY